MTAIRRTLTAAALAAAGLAAGCSGGVDSPDAVPDWAQDAVFYQIFPERFADGDPDNQPIRRWQEWPENVPESWTISDWTADWYRQADWERQMGGGFYGPIYNRRYGGDLQGVIDRLPYLDSLGVNALYFNPLFWARSLHKYDGNTFHHIDPYFGPDPEGDLAVIRSETADPATWRWTAADSLFLDLLDRAHARGIRVVLDGVFNHTGRDFFAFADIVENQQDSPYADWYDVVAFDDPETPENEFEYRGWWGVEALPEFADTEDGTDLHPGPSAYVFDATERWMDPNGDGDPDDGIDGWRLDVAPEVPVRFWQRWNEHVRSLNPAAYTVAEHWEDAAAFLEDGGFSATMNYHGFAFPVKGFLVDGRMPGSEFDARLRSARESFDPWRRFAMMNLVDGHDTDRLASMIVNRDSYERYAQPERFDYDWGERVTPKNGADRYSVAAPDSTDRRIQRLVALFQFTYIGAPMVYYGTEAGMWGADDPDDRQPMVWPEFDYEPRSRDPLGRPRPTDPVEFDHNLYQYYQELVGARNRLPALRRGAWQTLFAAPDRRILAFSRTLDDDVLIILLNREPDEQTFALSPAPPGTPRPVTGSGSGTATRLENGDLSVRMSGYSGLILEMSNPR